MSSDTDRILKIHGDRLGDHDRDINDIQKKQSADFARFEGVNRRLDDTNDRLTRVEADVGEIKGGVGRIEGMLIKMNGHGDQHDHDHLPPSLPPSPPSTGLPEGATRSNGKVIPMPSQDSKWYPVVLILYWGGIPGVVLLALFGALWLLLSFGLIPMSVG